MKQHPLGATLDQVCGRPPGSFKAHLERKRAGLAAMERNRQKRIQEAQRKP